MKLELEMKQCTKCGELLPSTDEYFYKQLIRSSDGDLYKLTSWCKECKKGSSSKWQNNNRDKLRGYQIKYNKKPHRKQMMKDNSDRRRDEGKHKEWLRNNPDKVKGYNDFRRMNKMHKITNGEWEDCKKYFNHRCAYCGLKIEEHWIKFNGNMQLGDFHKEHVDHNGSNDLSNCVPSCKACNGSKGNKDIDDWYNETRDFYDEERLNKIITWLYQDYILYLSK